MADSVNWNLLRDQLGAQLAEGLHGLVEGAAGDLQTFANQIAAEMVLALSTGDDGSVRELKAQLRVMAEVNRVRFAKAQEGMALKLISAVIGAAVGGLVSAGAKLGSGA